MSTSIVWDIETGSLPWEQIAPFYKPPTALPPWGPEMEAAIKYGNTKDPAKRAEKLAETKSAYEKTLADEGAAREAHRAEFIDKAALSALTCQVVAIGLKSEKGCKILAGDEVEIIKAFWKLYGNAVAGKRRMIGHNIFGFDLPVLVRRSYILGIDVPPGLLINGRFWADVFTDTMAVWGCGSREYVSLNDLSRVLGGPGKPTGEGACTGAGFAALYLSGDPEKKKQEEEYLMNDLAMPWHVAERMGLL